MSVAIRTAELSKTYRSGNLLSRRPGGDVHALERVSLEVKRGEIFGLVGPNGSGKTTLIRILSTLLRPTSGTAWVQGVPISAGPTVRASVGLATAEERSFFWRLSCAENLEFFAALQGTPRSRISAVAREMEIEEVLHRRFDRCSTGIKSRMGLARALLHDPPVLLLDEVSRSLDPVAALATRELLLRLVHTHGKAVLLVTHDPAEAMELCHRVGVLHRGLLHILPDPSSLSHLVAPEKTIEIRFRGPAPTPEDLQALEGVEEATRIDLDAGAREIHLSLDHRLKGLSGALELLRREGGRVESVETASRGWDEIVRQANQELDAREPDTSLPPAAPPRELLPPTSTRRQPGEPGSRILPQRLLAFFARDLRIQASYPLALVLELLGIFLSAASLFFVGRLVGSGTGDALSAYGGSYFPFALVGMAILTLQQLALGHFAHSVRQGQLTGTLEAMLATPTSIGTILAGGSQWPFLMAMVKIFAFFGAGALFFAMELSQARLIPALVFLALTVLAESGLGILSASFVLAFQRGDPIRFVIGALSALLAGVLYPVSVLPGHLQAAARFLPLAHALEGLRGALLAGSTLGELLPHALALLAFAAVLLPLGLGAFALAIRYAKTNGTLGQY